MTGILKSGSSYEYSFYAMLDAEDYKDAPGSLNCPLTFCHFALSSTISLSNSIEADFWELQSLLALVT